MMAADKLDVLRAFVDAHTQPYPGTGGRRPILYARWIGGEQLQHHALPDGAPLDADEALLERAPRRDIAVANGEDCLLRAERWPPELGLAYKPGMVHHTLSSRVHRREVLQNIVQRHAR